MTMTNSLDTSPEDSALLALPASHIPAMITPLDGDEGYHGGIGAAPLKNDLLVIVYAWLEIAFGDKCELYWDDDKTPVSTQYIDTPQKLEGPLLFHVSKDQIRNGPASPVFYKVTRPSQNQSDSFKLDILVKDTVPGGILSKPEPLGHPELRYTLTPDIKDGVDAEIAKHGITLHVLPYSNMARYDRIVARFGNKEEAFHYPVTSEQINNPEANPILITFDEALIKRAGNGKHSITFQVIDRCGNRPDSNAPWAIPTDVNVNLNRISAPTVPGEKNNQVDLAYLPNIEVVASGSGLATGDRVRVYWPGRVERETQSQTYSGSGPLQFPIPRKWANESNESDVTIKLKVDRAGQELFSEPNIVNIKTTIALKTPKVIEAYGPQGDRLKMSDIYYARHVTVRIERYLGMEIGQTIRVRWASARHVYDSPITTVTAVGAMDVPIPRIEVVDSIGRTLPVSFTVRAFPDGPLHRSDALQLTIDAQALDLPPPRLTADRTKVTVRFPAMATGLEARVRLGGIVTRHTAWQPLKTGITEEYLIPQTWLDENKGRTLLFNYAVNQIGTNEQSQFSQVLRVDP